MVTVSVGGWLNGLRRPGIALLLAVAGGAHAGQENVPGEAAQLRAIVSTLANDNADFARNYNAAYFRQLAGKPGPRATVLTCADAHVHTQALDKKPDGDLYIVRNLGNQIASSEGSVEYGVLQLRTPLLIIVGHASCDAVRAVRAGSPPLSAAIGRELAGLKLPQRNPRDDDNEDMVHAVQGNVDRQVDIALLKFAPQLKAGQLTIVGAVYDFQNILKQGHGRLVITNINGTTDAGGVLAGLMKISGIAARLERKHASKAIDNKAVD